MSPETAVQPRRLALGHTPFFVTPSGFYSLCVAHSDPLDNPLWPQCPNGVPLATPPTCSDIFLLSSRASSSSSLTPFSFSSSSCCSARPCPAQPVSLLFTLEVAKDPRPITLTMGQLSSQPSSSTIHLNIHSDGRHHGARFPRRVLRPSLTKGFGHQSAHKQEEVR